MLKGFLTLGALIVGGVIVADVLSHPTGTAAASSGISGLEVPALNGLLGVSPTGGKAIGGT
jgi:hypothetical protein